MHRHYGSLARVPLPSLPLHRCVSRQLWQQVFFLQALGWSLEEGRPLMIHTQERGTEVWWTETGAEEWADAIVAAMKLGGVENLFFVSGSELSFFQEAIAKAQALGRPTPRLVTMTHEHVA